MTVERQRITREAILQGASQLLESGDHGSLTVDALARSMHMSKSTLYKHFISKQALVVALVDAACSQAEAIASAPAKDRMSQVGEAMSTLSSAIPAAIFVEPSALPRGSRRRIEQARQAIAAQVASASGASRDEAASVGATYVASCFAAAEQAARSGADRVAAARAAHRVIVAGMAATA